MRLVLHAWFLMWLGLGAISAQADEPNAMPFVMQMTVGDSDAQRRAFLQIARHTLRKFASFLSLL